MINLPCHLTSVVIGKTVCGGCGGCGGCTGCTGGGGITVDSVFVEAGTNTFFGAGFFGVTGTHSFSEGKHYIIWVY